MAQTISGLAGFKALKAKRVAEQEAREKPKVAYFSWKSNKNKEDKNVTYVQFLQEFDKDIEGYDERFGLPLTAVEHTAPGNQGYLRRANCTEETEGQCYACERDAEQRAVKRAGGKAVDGWRSKSNTYLWALVDYFDGEGPKPVVISRSFNSSFIDDLLIEVEEDENNRITDKIWKITRSGTGKSTAWKLRQEKKRELFDTLEVEVPELKESVLRAIPYDEQAAYYGAVYTDGDPVDDDDDDTSAKPAAAPAAKQESGELEW